MKKIIILLSAFLLISLMGFTQKITSEKVPADVKQAFAKKFPAAIDPIFEMSNNYYKVIFNDEGVGTCVNYSPNGKWLQTETKILESDLPEDVTASVAADFAGFKISEVTNVETPDKPLFYTMNMQKDKETFNAQFSPKGDVLKKILLNK
jgi:hypothetical protein